MAWENVVSCSALTYSEGSQALFFSVVCIACVLVFAQGNTLPLHSFGSQDRLSSMRNKQLQATGFPLLKEKEVSGLVYVNIASLIIQLLYVTFPRFVSRYSS